MELKMIKRGAISSILAILFLLSLFVLVSAVTVPQFGLYIPLGPTGSYNFSGTVRVQANLTNAGTFFNLTNVSFYAYVPGAIASPVLIGHNTTANGTGGIYSVAWNTGSGSFPDNTTWAVFANGTGFNISAAIILDSQHVNVTIDNTPPTVTFLGDSPFQNPDETDYFNSITQQVNFSFRVIDNIFTVMSGPCIVKMDFNNATYGGNITSTTGATSFFSNNTHFNLTLPSFPAGSEGTHSYRVECLQDINTNSTGNSTSKTFVLDTVTPFINISLLDTDGNEQTQFGAGSEITARCLRGDSTSAVNSTAILFQNPVENTLQLKKTDLTVPPASTTLLTGTDFVIPGAETTQLGDYIVACQARDRAGNLRNINKTFTVLTQAPKGTSAYAIPGFKEPIAKTVIGVGGSSHAGDLTVDGLARLMSETARVSMSIDGEEHTFTVTEVGEGYVMLEVASDPFEVRVNEGETKQIDVNADGMNDVNVNLNMIYKNKADLIFTLLTEQTPVTSTSPDDTSTPVTAPSQEVDDSGFSFVTLFTILIIIILLAFVILHFVRKRDQDGGPASSSDLRFSPRDLGMQREQDVPFGGYGGNRAPGPKSSPPPPKSFY